jgi:hypothetical protein
MSTRPTDAELKAMWQLHAADIGGIFYYARAVLEKWGQPAQVVDCALEGERTVSRDGRTVEASVNPHRQPAPATQQAGEVRPVTPYTCPKCHALWLHWPAEQTGFGRDTLNCRSADHCHYCEKAGVEQLQRLERISAALHAPQPSPTVQAAESVQEDAARYRWLREGNDANHGAAWHVAVNLYGCEWDAAIDAAMNKGATP